MRSTAASAGITRLYHYERFHPDYLHDTLCNQRVHCSDLANLNDPWDCRPWFDEESLDDPRAAERLIQRLYALVPASPAADDQVMATQMRIHTDSQYRRDILARSSQDFLSMIRNRWRVYCMTPFPDSTLMWSHYADNHRGICLEFALDNAVLGSAQEVVYRSSYPKWAPHAIADPETPHVLLIKSDDWRYEHEYRIIGLGDGIARPDFSDHPLLLRGEFLQLPPGALQAVIVGCNADYEGINAVVARIHVSVKIKRAVRARTKYRLEIVD